MEEWTIEDVCTFVQGLRQEFGDQASVYAAAMKEQAIDGKALLHLSAANPIADNKLKELGVKIGHRMKLKSCIQGLQLASQVPPSSTASPETPASRCTAPSAHPPQVMLRIRPSPSLYPCLTRSLGRSLFPARALSLVCVFIKRVVISAGQSVSCRERRFLVCVFSNTRWLYMAASQRH